MHFFLLYALHVDRYNSAWWEHGHGGLLCLTCANLSFLFQRKPRKKAIMEQQLYFTRQILTRKNVSRTDKRNTFHTRRGQKNVRNMYFSCAPREKEGGRNPYSVFETAPSRPRLRQPTDELGRISVAIRSGPLPRPRLLADSVSHRIQKETVFRKGCKVA